MENPPLVKQKRQIEAIRTLLYSRTVEERLAKMSPESRALYESIIAVRNEVGRLDNFDIVAELRGIRGSNDESAGH